MGASTENKSGRPSKFTPEKATKICAAIENGATYEDAAATAGVTYNTLLSWKQKGEAAFVARAEHGVEWWKPTALELQFLDFFEQVKIAEDKGENALLSRIVDAGRDPDHWQANAWILERRYPKKYGKALTLKGDPENPLSPVRDMTDEEVEKRAREILAKRHHP